MKHKSQLERLQLVLEIVDRAYDVLQYSTDKSDIVILEKINELWDLTWEHMDSLRQKEML